jgi:hypothetical protein
MTNSRIRYGALALTAVFTLLVATGRADGAPASAAPQDVRTASVQAVSAGQTTIIVSDQDATLTRQRLIEILRRQPSSLGRVLKLDPSLLANQAYLAPYPALATFLAQHPEVAHNPGYYLQAIDVPEVVTSNQRSEMLLFWRGFIGDVVAFSVFCVIVATLTWLVRLIVDHRRWNRVSKVQAEVHNKLLDRLTANDELVAYMQSSAGARFLESAPIQMDAGPRSVSAPLGRILLSVQIGIVLAAGGFGLLAVNRWLGPGLDADVTVPMFTMSVLAIALGIGFAVSALVSYMLSARLGLLEPVTLPSAERGAAATRHVS